MARRARLPMHPDDCRRANARIEDRIKDRLEADRTAILALVITCAGARELYFYTADPRAAIRAWEDDLQPDNKTHQVRFEIRLDEDWRVYRKLA